MRLTEKENETLPIDVSGCHPNKLSHNLSSPQQTLLKICFSFVADCITDPAVVCDDLLWDCAHCWRVQRHGRLIRAEKQVSNKKSSTFTSQDDVDVCATTCHRGGHVQCTSPQVEGLPVHMYKAAVFLFINQL